MFKIDEMEIFHQNWFNVNQKTKNNNEEIISELFFDNICERENYYFSHYCNFRSKIKIDELLIANNIKNIDKTFNIILIDDVVNHGDNELFVVFEKLQKIIEKDKKVYVRCRPWMFKHKNSLKKINFLSFYENLFNKFNFKILSRRIYYDNSFLNNTKNKNFILKAVKKQISSENSYTTEKLDLIPTMKNNFSMYDGNWTLCRNLIMSDATCISRFLINYVPTNEYVIDLEVCRCSGNDALVFTLKIKDLYINLVLDGFPSRGYISGFELVNKHRFDQNKYKISGKLFDHSYKNLKIEVSNNDIRVSLNDKKILHYKNESNQIDIIKDWIFDGVSGLYVSSYFSSFKLKNISIRENCFMDKNGYILNRMSINIVDYILSQQYCESFDEQHYLENNLDVAKAVANCKFSSGLDHYLKYGFKENRNVVINKLKKDFNLRGLIIEGLSQ